MSKEKKKVIIESVISTVFLGLLVYAAYSLWYIFYGKDSGADVHLYTILSGSALGWFFLLFVDALSKKSNVVLKIIVFLFGNGLFQGVIWGFNKELNPTCTDNEPVVIKSFTVAFVLCAVVALVTFILRTKKGFKALNIILAIIYFVISCGGVLVLNINNIKALEYKKNIQFDRISAEEIAINNKDNKLCEDWYDNNIKSEKYPFTFKVDGKEFNPSEWEKDLVKKADVSKKYQGGTTENIVFTNKKTGLKVTLEATSFNKNATCQWVVYIENTGTEKSGIISDFYAYNSSINTGKADIYYSMGSDTAASDFSLIKKALTSERVFSGNEGKPTEKYMPYFNICGENAGVVVGVGWTGQWASSFSNNNGETSVTVKQEEFNAYLLPGESVRSPLVSLTFYDNTNPLKGFNLFRKWVMDSVYPESVTQNQYTVMEIAGPAHTRTSDEIINILDNEIADYVYDEIDAFWMDAGWYSYKEGWHDGVGNWTVDTSRYDNGISELSGYAAEKGLGHVLWYEPERLFPGTHFHTVGTENEGWLVSVDGEDNIMWNLANEDAFKYYCDYILKSLKENGVTVYRQDFNFAPLKYWEKADAEYYDGRRGVCENHYVTNLYRFLDYLCENIDGLIIDNCASGGKRLDLEMTYRSIAFWRSDYNCSYHSDLFEATQSHTYGISFWLPITGSALYMEDEYASRSDIMPLMLMDFYSHQNSEFSFNKEPRELMTGNYYPLDFGSFDKNKMMAMQFSSADFLSGTALVYKRENVNQKEYFVKFNGLSENVTYNVTNVDEAEKMYTLTGKELMEEGLRLVLPEGRKAIILMYKAQ